MKLALYCLDETRRSMLSFALTTRLRADVTCPETQADLISLLYCHDSETGDNDIRCVVIVHAGSSHDTRTTLFRVSPRFNVPTILVGKLSETPRAIYATLVLPSDVETVDLLEAVRRIAARKRGPKKLSQDRSILDGLKRQGRRTA